MKRLAALALALPLLASMLAAPARAGSLAGVTMPDTVEVAGQNLVLNGMALRSKAVFKVYVGGLYLPAKQGDWKQVLAADTPRHMAMHWLRSVDKDAICGAWQEGLEANTPNASAEVAKNFETLCGMMEAARTGDRFTFTYLPGTGTQVEINGKAKGTLGAKAFADALFAAWIGPKPGPGEAFRDDLMGN
jgi:hypothetical protein